MNKTKEPELMTAAECEHINNAARKFQHDLERDRAKSRGMQIAQARQERRGACSWWIGWTVFAWAVAFCGAAILMHLGRIAPDTTISLIGGVSIVAGMAIGNLIRRMGE